MKRILIIAPNWIGDAVMSQPLLASLKATFSESTIDVLASAWVAPIYRACSEVNAVIESKLEHKQLQWALRRTLAVQLEANQYDVCYVLPNSFKSAIIPWLAKIPLRIGYRGEMRFGLLNVTLKNPSKLHRPPMMDHYLALSRALELASENTTNKAPLPTLNVSAPAQQAVLQKLRQAQIHENAFYVFCPGAEYGPTKRWPAERFASLAQQVLSTLPQANVILLGSTGDHTLASSIQTQTNLDPRIWNWCGETSLDEAIALIDLCKTLVSNDSGLMHIGAALKTPQIAIFGSSDPHHTPPLSDQARVLWLQLPCSPCHKRECPLGHLRCLKEITAQDVFGAIQELPHLHSTTIFRK